MAALQGASQEVIDKLKTEVATLTAAEGDEHNGITTRCTVCLEDPVEGDVMRVLPCVHKFHKACIDQWLGVKACCPICLRDVREES